MSATSTNIVQANTDPPRPLLRPIYHILRPGNRLVPLIAGDELPSWLKVVGSYHVDMTNSVTVNEEPYPRKGEYDIICQYCVDATEHIHDQSRNDTNQEEQGRDALGERDYAPTARNQYKQRVPAAFEASVQQLKQRQPVQTSQPQFLQPGQLWWQVQFQQPAPFPQPGPPNLPPIQPAQTVPPFLPAVLSLSLPSMPSLPSQPSGLQHLQQQAMQRPPQQQQRQRQLQYPQQQMSLPQQPYRQNWGQERSRTRDRDHQYHHVWQQRPQPGQQCRRVMHEEPRSHVRSRSPVVTVRQGEQTRGLNAAAPAFVPSSVAPLATPPAAGSVDGSAVLVKR